MSFGSHRPKATYPYSILSRMLSWKGTVSWSARLIDDLEYSWRTCQLSIPIRHTFCAITSCSRKSNHVTVNLPVPDGPTRAMTLALSAVKETFCTPPQFGHLKLASIPWILFFLPYLFCYRGYCTKCSPMTSIWSVFNHFWYKMNPLVVWWHMERREQ